MAEALARNAPSVAAMPDTKVITPATKGCLSTSERRRFIMLLHGLPPWVCTALRAAGSDRQFSADVQWMHDASNSLCVLSVRAVVLVGVGVGVGVVMTVRLNAAMPLGRGLRSPRARSFRRHRWFRVCFARASA